MKAILVIDVDDIDIDIENTQVTYLVLHCNNHTRQVTLINHWLQPMPTKKLAVFDPDHCDIEEEIKIIHEIEGYNRCIDEILGGTE